MPEPSRAPRHRVSRPAAPRRATRLYQRAAGAVSEGFFHSLSRLGKLHPASRPERHGVEVYENIPYAGGGDRYQQLDIYRPLAHPGPQPIVLYVHGGGFRALSKDTHWIMALAFARAGYLVFNISYRLAPRHPFPAPLADTCAAYEWVVENAAAYGGDITRLAVAGESAGANLVSALTLATCFERPEPFARRVFDTGVTPRATLPYCGLLEVSNPERFGQRRSLPVWVTSIINHCSDGYLRATDERAPDHLDLANPLTTLERAARQRLAPDRPLPPFFLAVGTRDPLLDDTRRLERALNALDVACEARYYPGEIHAFHALVWRKQARQAWRDTFGFLARRLRPGRESRAVQAHAARARGDEQHAL